MSVSEIKQKLREEIVRVARTLLETNLVLGTSGNVSAKVPGEEAVLITPSMVEYPELKPEDIPLVNYDGEVLEGDKPPSTEKAMHLAVHKARKDVGAVIHAHSLYGTVLGIVGKPLPIIIDEMAIKLGGTVEVAEYRLAGTPELAEIAVKALGNKAAVFLANHGTLCCGRDLKEALHITQFVERMSQIYILSMLIGKPNLLPEDSVKMETEVYRLLHRVE
ncbi:MAG: class II aldolase/adducin family protein [Candidatus Freyarchaeota archaeon]